MIPDGYLHHLGLAPTGDIASVNLTSVISLHSHVGSLMRLPDADKDLSALHMMLLQWSYIS